MFSILWLVFTNLKRADLCLFCFLFFFYLCTHETQTYMTLCADLCTPFHKELRLFDNLTSYSIMRLNLKYNQTDGAYNY